MKAKWTVNLGKLTGIIVCVLVLVSPTHMAIKYIAFAGLIYILGS